jgi:hypothetical protein
LSYESQLLNLPRTSFKALRAGRTFNVEHRILMSLRFIYLKTTELQPATSPSVMSLGFNDSLRQAQGFSLSKAAESNFEGKLRSCSASSP